MRYSVKFSDNYGYGTEVFEQSFKTFEEAFERYIIEYSALKRYANRRGALKKLRNVIEEYTDIKPEDIGI